MNGLPLPPPLTEEQRKDALAKAAEARRRRANLKEALKSGTQTLGDLLDMTDEVVAKMKVSSVLEALPGVGKVRARKIMDMLEISESRRIRVLGTKEKISLLKEFEAR